MGRSKQKIEDHGRENLDYLEHMVGINVDYEDATREVLEGNRIKN